MIGSGDDLKVLEAKNLQLGVLDGPVDAERSEPVHLRRRLPLVTEVPRSLQLNVYPATSVSFQSSLFKEGSQALLFKPGSGSAGIKIRPFPFIAST